MAVVKQNLCMNLLAIYRKDNQTVELYEGNEVRTTDHDLIPTLDYLCRSAGSTLQGRLDAARELTMTVQNPPFVVAPELAFLTTKSLANDECMCINAYRIEKVITHDKVCIVRFDTGEELELNISRRTFNRLMEDYVTLLCLICYPLYGYEPKFVSLMKKREKM